MNYKDFIKEYNATKDKTELLSKHLTTEYVPIATKMAEAKKVAERSQSVTDENGKTIIMRNTPLQFYLFALRMIVLYTDIECADEDVTDMFDTLNKENVINILFSQVIPQREYAEFQQYVLQSCDDYYENMMGLTQYLDRKIEALSTVLTAMTESLAELIPSEENSDKITKFPTKED